MRWVRKRRLAQKKNENKTKRKVLTDPLIGKSNQKPDSGPIDETIDHYTPQQRLEKERGVKKAQKWKGGKNKGTIMKEDVHRYYPGLKHPGLDKEKTSNKEKEEARTHTLKNELVKGSRK